MATPTHDLDAIEAMIQQLVPRACPPPADRGRPAILPSAMLWCGLLVCVLRRTTSQQAVWRLLTETGLWAFPRIAISAEAVRLRIVRAGSTVMQDLFTHVTQTLAPTIPPDRTIAPFATGVYALDESTLDHIARTLPVLRAIPTGDDRLLPGKLIAAFDVRTQLFTTIRTTDLPHQNEKLAARDLVRTLPLGSLILADLGYFAFPWFDELIAAGYQFVSRLREKTSTEPIHVFTDQDGVRDELVWLGAYRTDRAAHAMRLVTLTHGTTIRRYLTSVRDPAILPPHEIVPLYARRWSIEQAFRLIKQELHLHLLWSAKWELILTQLYAVLIIAQITRGLRAQIAAAAGIPVEQVSERLLLRDLPLLVQQADGDLIGYLAILPVVKGGYLRPVRRTTAVIPTGLPVVPLPPTTILTRPPRYAARKSTAVHIPLEPLPA